MSEIKFEDNLLELEKIVLQLENDNVDLDNSIKLFEKGIDISKTCKKQLEIAKQKVILLTDLMENGEENG